MAALAPHAHPDDGVALGAAFGFAGFLQFGAGAEYHGGVPSNIHGNGDASTLRRRASSLPALRFEFRAEV
jgi:hypothetical protein